jgi:CMP-N,N'-diacetyllegionaminic acid synthase
VSPTVLGLIPARGGSKSIPRKNIAPLAGKPLLAYTAAAALGAASLAHTVLSTDDAEIAEIGRALGLDVPFLRPTDLADDAAPMLPVMRHALDWFAAQGRRFDAVAVLQPTSPLRRSRHIDEALALLVGNETADSVVSVVEVPHQFNPVSVMRLDAGRLTPFLPGPPILRRQDKPKVYARNGPAVLAVRTAAVQRGVLYSDTTIGYVMSPEASLDIDDASDFWLAEQWLRKGANEPS